MGYRPQEEQEEERDEEEDEENTNKTLLRGGLSPHSFTFLNIFRFYFPTTHKKYMLYVLFCPATLLRFGDLASQLCNRLGSMQLYCGKEE